MLACLYLSFFATRGGTSGKQFSSRSYGRCQMRPMRFDAVKRWLLGGRSFDFVVLGLLVVVAAGCSDGRPKRVEVSGQVLIDDEPVPAGSIRFVPEGARPSASDLDGDGRFTLRCFEENDGAVVGTHRVQVAAREIEGGSVVWHAPQKYSDIESSGLTVEISEPTDSLLSLIHI